MRTQFFLAWALCLTISATLRAQVSSHVTAIQYFYNTDPGVGIPGDGGIISVTPAADLQQQVSIGLPAELEDGFHNLYLRVKDAGGRWSLVERRLFFINRVTGGPKDIVAYQYYFDNDLSDGVIDDGATVPITPTANLDQQIAINLPASLGDGFHNLYIRTQDADGAWSLTERRLFFINRVTGGPKDIIAYQYYFDNDLNDGVIDDGATVPITPTANLDQQLAINIPASLGDGFHNLYFRTQDADGVWSLAERRLFFITTSAQVPHDIAALEYYFNDDPGVGEAYPYPVNGTTDFDMIIDLDVPCLATGTNYLYIRAQDDLGRWSIIERDTLEVTGGIPPPVVSPAGPVYLCEGQTASLSVDPVEDVSYQWQLDFVGFGWQNIAGGTSPDYETPPLAVGVYTYRVAADCGGNTSYSNEVTIIVENNVEVCNGVDDDCDGLVDEDDPDLTDPTTWYADADGDGYGDPVSFVESCSQPTGYVINDQDCDDTNAGVNPTSAEACNGIDDNCDGNIDEGVQVTFYADADGDGYGDPATLVLDCSAPVGYVTNNTDCDDTDANINPAATEICNGVDDECDGLVDDDDPGITGQATWYADADGDSYGDAGSTVLACSQPAGYVSDATDCDDTNPLAYPGATEACDGVDNDCDGLVDDDDPDVSGQSTWYADADGDGYGDALSPAQACDQPAGHVGNSDDCNDNDPLLYPGAAEICNGADDDCDGLVDDDDPDIIGQSLWYADSDGDGYGDPAASTLACNQPVGYVADDTDCDDTDTDINPGVAEVCNGLDDNCDGNIDEGFDYATAPASISSTSGTSLCPMESTQLSVTGGSLGSGGQWVWYAGGCGAGSPLGTGTTLDVTPATDTDYFVRAEGSCNTTECATMHIDVLTAPTFTSCPVSFTVSTDAGACVATVAYSIVTASDPAPSYTYTFSGATSGSGPGTGSGFVFNVGTSDISILAANTCGDDVCNFTLTVEDNEVPVIACPADIVTDVEDGQWGAHVDWTAPAPADNCGIDDVQSSHTPGSFFVAGTQPVTYLATDIHGNTSVCTFDVTVEPPSDEQQVNVAIFANDITFSNPNPAPGAEITVTATVHNTSNVDAGPFNCRLVNHATNLAYSPDIPVPGLKANQSTSVTWTITTPPTAAFVPMQVLIDIDNALSESNELDNQAIRPFINGDYSIVGEIVVVPQAIPAIAPAGSTISICGNAYYDNTAVLLADSSVAGAQLKVFIDETGTTLTGVTDANGDFCVSFRTPNTSGIYNFIAEVTDFTLTGETPGTFELETPVITCPLDLSVRIYLDGDYLCGQAHHIVEGSSLSGTVRVLNSCSVVTDGTEAFVALDGTPITGSPFPVPALASGASHDIAISSMTFNTPGTFTISATADYNDVVSEDVETNNTRSVTIVVHPATPDIVPVDAKVSECPYVLNFTIANQGGVPTGDFEAELEIYQGGTLEQSLSQTVGSIDALCRTQITFPFTPSGSGDYTFVLHCDPDDLIGELSETNNIFSRPTYLNPCLVDLVVFGCSSTDVKPTDPLAGNTIQVTATIANVGDETAFAPFDVEFDVAGSLHTATVNADLTPGAAQILTVDATAPAHGNNNLIVEVDANLDVSESNESNNSYSAPLCWDFEPSNVKCDGLPAISGTQLLCNPVQFETVVYNHGLYEASSMEVQFEISGPGLPAEWTNLGSTLTFIDRTCSCPRLIQAPGTFIFPQTGVYQVRITADPGDTYTECAEDNNQVFVDLNVVESPDYAVYSQYIAPSLLNPALNEEISIDVSYANEGCTGQTPIELFVQVDNTPLESVVVPALPSGDVGTVPLTQTWSSGLPGVHVIREFIDYGEAVTEANELNNEATRSVVVGDATNLTLADFQCSDLSPSTAQVVTLTALIENNTGVSATGVLRMSYAGVGGEETIFQQPFAIDAMSIISMSTDWLVTDPNARLIARITDADPIEYDLTDNTLELQLNQLAATLTITDVACADLELGTIEASVIGGQPPYLFEWSNGYTGHTIQVPSGAYSLTITDANGLTVANAVAVADLATPLTWFADFDDDGFGDPTQSILSCETPVGYVLDNTDCNDLDTLVNPAAQEVCNGIDDDCDGLVDDDDGSVNGQFTWYFDSDGDGFGDAQVAIVSCNQPPGYVGSSTDCDDTDPASYPGATEILDGLDNDCDGAIDEDLNTLSIDAGDCTTTFFGYAPEECAILQVYVEGGQAPYTYAWSNAATTQSTTVCPEETQAYTIVVTDALGYSVADEITVQVIDIRCGNGNTQKVSICHLPPGNPENVQNICIGISAMDDHLALHGDYLGACGAVDPCGTPEAMTLQALTHTPGAAEPPIRTTDVLERKMAESIEISLIPNPARDVVTLSIRGTQEPVSVYFFDGIGRQVKKLDEVGQAQMISTQDLPAGMYYVILETIDGLSKKKLIVIK